MDELTTSQNLFGQIPVFALASFRCASLFCLILPLLVFESVQYSNSPEEDLRPFFISGSSSSTIDLQKTQSSLDKLFVEPHHVVLP